jgi:transcriptional regulator with XRE-family HTH domain
MLDGKRLRQLREAYGYNRKELADRIGVAEGQVVRYELGKNDATGEVLSRMAKALNVSSDYLLGISDEPYPQQTESLKPKEAAAIAAWREGDYWRAVKIMAADE